MVSYRSRGSSTCTNRRQPQSGPLGCLPARLIPLTDAARQSPRRPPAGVPCRLVPMGDGVQRLSIVCCTHLLSGDSVVHCLTWKHFRSLDTLLPCIYREWNCSGGVCLHRDCGEQIGVIGIFAGRRSPLGNTGWCGAHGLSAHSTQLT